MKKYLKYRAAVNGGMSNSQWPKQQREKNSDINFLLAFHFALIFVFSSSFTSYFLRPSFRIILINILIFNINNQEFFSASKSGSKNLKSPFLGVLCKLFPIIPDTYLKEKNVHYESDSWYNGQANRLDNSKYIFY